MASRGARAAVLPTQHRAPPPGKPWRRGRQYWLFRLGAGLAGALPAPWAMRLADACGVLAYWLAPTARANVRANLGHVLGRPPTSGQVRAVFRHGARDYYDLLRLPHLSADDLRRLVTVRGWENLDAARAPGRGVLLVTAHLGSVGLVGQMVAVGGCPANVVVEALPDPAVLDLLMRLRGSHGIRPLPVGPHLPREILAALARNEVVGLLVDRDVTGGGSTVRFFDAPARLPTGAASLALRSGAAVLPAFTARQPGGRYLGWFEPPLDLVRTGDRRADVRTNTERITRAIEAAIRRYPEQWTVCQPVWPAAEGASGG